MSRQDPGRPPNFGEMCEWAERNFPIEFACFQAKVDNMMTPKELPYGWDPNYPQTPKPLLRDWISPTDTDRSALSFQSHLCLNIGYYQQPGRKLDQLHVFSAQTDTINMFFCREIKSDSKFVRVQPSRAMNDKGLVLYPLWNALRKSETDPENCGLIRTAALWLHVQRMLVPDFRGIHACKERFKAVCVAWTTYASSHPHLLKFPETGVPPFRPIVAPPPVSQRSDTESVQIEDVAREPGQPVAGSPIFANAPPVFGDENSKKRTRPGNEKEQENVKKPKLGESLEEENRKLKAKNNQLQADNTRLKDKLNTEHTKMKARNSRLEAENHVLKNKEIQLEGNKTNLHAQIDQLEAENTNLKAKNDHLEDEMDILKEKIELVKKAVS